MRFVADENFPLQAARLLSHVYEDHIVESTVDLFGRGVPDVYWIPQLGRKNPKPCVLGFDKDILRNPAEKKIFRETNLTYILFDGTWQVKWEDQAWKLVRVWPKIVKTCGKLKVPNVFKINVNGKWYDHGPTAKI